MYEKSPWKSNKKVANGMNAKACLPLDGGEDSWSLLSIKKPDKSGRPETF
jgi:hypothetical protein